MRTTHAAGLPLLRVMFACLAALLGLSAHAATITWSGLDGITPLSIDAPNNWVGGVVPSVSVGDTAEWIGSPAGALSLTYDAATYAGAAGNPGISLSITGSQTDPVSIDSGLNTGSLRMNNITIGSGAGAFSLGNGANTFNLTLGGAAGFHTWVNDSTTATIGSDVVWGLGGGGVHTLFISGVGNWNFYNVMGQGSGTLNITKNGSGTVTLTNANTFTGTITNTLGTLNLSGSLATGGGAVIINPAAGTTATMNLSTNTGSGSFLRTGAFNVGTVAGGTGILNIGAGTTLNMSGGTSALLIGNGGYGVYNQLGGTVTSGQYLVAGITTVGAVGVMNISGGSFSPKTGNNGGTVGATAGTAGQLNLTGTGSYTSTDATANGAAGIYIGESGVGTLNISGSATMTLGGVATSAGLRIGVNAGSSGVANLGAVGSGGGTITTMRVGTGNTGARSALNFHGGTLKASTGANPAFLNGLTVANVYGEGAVIDDNGQPINIAQSLLAPAGNGVAGVASLSGGSGYTAAPYVTISRATNDITGQYATAIAQIDSSSGAVTNILITNPGINYTAPPIFTLTGGNPTSPATVTGAAPVPNVSGGLTKNGAGTNVLLGANTFTNTTTVTAGKLVLAGTQFSSRQITVNDGAKLGLALPGSTQVAPVTLTVGNSTGATLDFAVSSTVTAPLTPTTLTLNGANTINILAGNFVAGNSYPLITYTTLSGAGTYALGTLPNGVAGTITTVGNTIQLNVTTVTNTIWAGGVNGTWDINTTANWTAPSGGTTYLNGSVVQFDDTGLNTVSITNISGTFVASPGAILVTNVTKNYAIKTVVGGNGALVKAGTATLTNTAANTYTGPTTINQGTVVAGVASVAGVSGALGLNSAVTLANDATAVLNLNGNATQIGSLAGGGAAGGNVVLGAGALTVGGNNSASTYAGTISGTGGLNKIGSGTLTFGGTNLYTGTTTLNGGTVTYASGAVVNTTAGIVIGTGSGGAGSGGTCTVNVNSGSALYFGNISYVGYHTGNGVLNLNGGAFTNANDFRVGGSDSSGFGRDAYGTVNLTSGNMNLSSLTVARGNNFQNSVSGSVTVSGGTLTSTNDLILGYAGTGLGKLAISGSGVVNVGTFATKWMMIQDFDTASGELDITNGTLNLMNNTALKFSAGNASSGGTNVVNQYGGSVVFYSDAGVTVGGTGDLNLAQGGSATAINTYNLNGGTLTVPAVASATTLATRVFNFNGGTLKPTASSATFFNLGTGSAVANVRDNGAIIDSNGKDITVAQPLVHSTIVGDNATDGGLTKLGAGTLTLSGGSTYTGPTFVSAGTLSLDASMTAPSPAGNMTVSNATLNLFLNNGANSFPAANVILSSNAVLNLDYGTLSGTPVVALNAASGLQVAGPATINVAGFGLVNGTITLIDYTGSALTGPQFANLAIGTLPPGVVATLVNNTANTSVDLNITSTGQNLFWRGVDDFTGLSDANWNIATTTNWYGVGGTIPSVYKEYTSAGVTVGDPVLFDDNVASYLNTTNVDLSTTVRPFKVVVDSTLPYSITGTGGIAGQGKLIKTNSGSVFVGTTNSYTGGTIIGGGALIITNNSALGTNSGTVTMVGGTLQLNGSVTNSRGISFVGNSSFGAMAGSTSLFSGVISGSSTLTKIDNGTLSLNGSNTFNGLTIVDFGTLQVSGGTFGHTNSNIEVSPNVSDTGTFTVSGGTVSANRVIISGNSGNTGTFGPGVVNQTGGTINSRQWFTVGSGANGGASGAGTFNMSGGILNVHAQQMEVGNFTATTGTLNLSGTGTINIWNNNFLSMGANNDCAGATVNQTGGSINFFSDAGLTPGGTGILYLGRAGTLAGTFTYNLGGGSLNASQIQRNTANTATATFNFNGGTLKATRANATFMFGLTAANVLSGGAIIDSSTNNITISQALLDGGGGGGLTKQGTAALSLSGSDTYAGSTVISGGSLFVTPAHMAPGSVSLASGTAYGITLPAGPGAVTNASLNLAAGTTALSFGMGTNGNSAAALLVVGPLTNNGTLTVTLGGSVARLTVGAFPLVKYTGTIQGAGSLNGTIAGPQGTSILLSNGVASSTLYAVITNLGSGIIWTGTNPTKTNIWDLNTTTNWLIGASATRYNETIPPGDAVTFNDSGSSIVLLSNTASPASMLISNSSVNYTFQGSGHISGPMNLTKLGSATATMTYAGNDYTGDTIVSNGTYKLGVANIIPDGLGKGNVVVSGTLDLNGFSDALNGLSGSGTVDNTASAASTVAMGTSGGTFSYAGAFSQSGGGALTVRKDGTGSQTISGPKSFTGNLNVRGGVLNFNGSSMTTTSAAVRVVENSAASVKAILNIGTDLSAQNLWVGDFTNGAAGAVYQTGGNVNLAQGASVDNLRIGSIATGQGYYKMSGGSLNLNEMNVGGANNDTIGVMDVTGGTITNNGYLILARGGATCSAALNVTGGSLLWGYSLGTGPLDLGFGATAGASAVLTVGGGGGSAAVTGPSSTLATTTFAGFGLNLASANVAGTFSAVNLLTNGTLTVCQVTAANANPTTLLNFNGGTLKATAPNNLGLSFMNSGNVDGVYVYGNGGTIDNNGTAITVGDALIPPTGSGVTSIAVTDGGSGYVGAPLVTVTGGTGNSATAYATMVDDGTGAGTYKVSAIIVSSPGDYSDTTGLTVVLAGGAPVTGATIGTISTAANSSGGMTFTGTGTSTLSGANTYTGLTTVGNGTLVVDGSLAGAVTVKPGATLGGNGTIGGVVTVQAGGTLGAGASIGLLTLNSSPVLGGTVVAEIDRNGGTPLNDEIAIPASPVTYGGSLVVSNVGAALTTNDVFQLFTATVHSGNFTSITNTGTPLNPGLSLFFTNGVLKVISSSTVATNPTNITSIVTGGTNLALSWPADHLGWTLITQTNSRSVGLRTPTNTWFDVDGSSSMTGTNFPIGKDQTNVFFRLRLFQP